MAAPVPDTAQASTAPATIRVFVRMTIDLSCSRAGQYTPGSAWVSSQLFLRRRRLRRLLAQFAVHQLFDELDALELHQLRVRLDAAIQRHGDLPRPRESVRIFDRRLVPDVIGAAHRVTLGHFQLVA